MPEYTLADVVTDPNVQDLFHRPPQRRLAYPPLPHPTDVPAVTDQPLGYSEASLHGSFGPGGGFVGGVPTDALLDNVRLVESGGNDRAMSPKGAVGPFQIMPTTGMSPGYGVSRIFGQDLFDRERSKAWAREYLSAMYAKYQNPMLAVAAYNAGPGNIDRALANGGFAAMPGETQDYVRRVGVYP